jgi:MFS family permease
MWELYAFWAFVPVLLSLYVKKQDAVLNIPFWSFSIIAAGAVGCIAGGYLTKWYGSAKVAFAALCVSGICCVLAYFSFSLPAPVFLFFMIIWGIAVVADSPQFSSIVAQTAVAENKGAAITIVTCIGFSVTVVSIYLLNFLFEAQMQSSLVLLILAPGPLFGLWKMYPLLKEKAFE